MDQKETDYCNSVVKNGLEHADVFKMHIAITPTIFKIPRSKNGQGKIDLGTAVVDSRESAIMKINAVLRTHVDTFGISGVHHSGIGFFLKKGTKITLPQFRLKNDVKQKEVKFSKGEECSMEILVERV